MKDFTTEELYYIAGLLEGEGSFTSGANQHGTKYIDIKLKMTDHDIVEWVADKWECSIFTEHFENHWKTAYQTQLRRKKECIEFLKLIYPLMGKRRKEKIESILEVFDDNFEQM